MGLEEIWESGLAEEEQTHQKKEVISLLLPTSLLQLSLKVETRRRLLLRLLSLLESREVLQRSEG